MSLRQPLIAGNWKMYTSLSDAIVLATAIKNGVAHLEEIEIVLIPPFVWLYPIFEILEKKPSFLKLGAQNMYHEDEGAFTGEISPKMLKGLCQYVILGHSERKENFGETDDLIADKIQSALRHNLTPIICLGEFKKNSQTKSEVFKQLKSYLERVPKDLANKMVLVYEPVWAIGTGKPATGIEAASMIMQIRQMLAKMYNLETAGKIRILYGGSVDGKNILEFANHREIDGALVGGASLKAKEFIEICRQVAQS